MKKTILTLILLSIISPVLVDILPPMLGGFTKVCLFVSLFLIWLSSLTFLIIAVMHLFIDREDKILPDNLDEIIFGGKK